MSTERKIERIRVNRSTFPTHGESLFIEPNDYCTIRYQGHVASLKSTRGLHYLAVLLRDLGREFHVSELLAHSLSASTPRAGVAVPEGDAGWTLFRIPSLGRSGEDGV